MSRTKIIAFILFLAASTILTAPIASASITKPSVPEFTVDIVDQSYDTPATTPTFTTDPYTGEQKQLTFGSPSYHVENKSIEITIKNQPFTPYTDSSGNYIQLQYNIKSKGHYGDKWFYDPFNPDGESSQSYGGWDMTYLVAYTASNSEYTVITYPLTSALPDKGKEDFQVQAQIGYIQQEGNDFTRRVYGVRYNFTGESSDWSSTKTITIGSGEVATSQPTIQPTQNPTAAPTQTNTETPVQTEVTSAPSGLTWKDIVIVAAFAVIAALAAALVLTRRKKQ